MYIHRKVESRKKESRKKEMDGGEGAPSVEEGADMERAALTDRPPPLSQGD